MLERTRWIAVGAGVAALWVATPVHAQDPTGGAPPPVRDDATDPATVMPPSLKVHPDAVYPPDALRDRIEGSVGIEVTVDESGNVADARVTQPAGHGFDEAALAAVRQWTFEPARTAGKPVRAIVELALPFELPPAAAPAALEPSAAPAPPVAPPVPVPAAAEVSQPGETTVVLGRKPISAASSFAVRDRDFSLRPVDSVQDILRVTPGPGDGAALGRREGQSVFLARLRRRPRDGRRSVDRRHSDQHGLARARTGIRGYELHHPRDRRTRRDHQGPVLRQPGRLRDRGRGEPGHARRLRAQLARLRGGGSPGYGEPSYRGLLVASPKFESTKALFAAEIGRQNGPFENPEGWDRYKLFNKVTFELTPTSSFTLGESSYSGNWNGSGQIPARAVDQGLVARFGSLDPNEGGNTARHQLFVVYKLRPNEHSDIQALAYLGTYRFNLFSNFTLYLDDPENGDEIQQIDRRTFYGGKASYRIVHDIGGVPFDTTMGGRRPQRRHPRRALAHRRARRARTRSAATTCTRRWSARTSTRRSRPSRRSASMSAAAPTCSRSRSTTGSSTTDPTNPRSGIGDAHQFSPKASAVLTPLGGRDAQIDVYANWGNGFHSNDVRGVFTTPSVTPLTRAIGEEVGARARLFGRWDLAASGWLLDLDNETTWDGDDGTTGVSPATRRYGVEFETRFEFTPWLAADANATFTHSQFSTDRANGNGLALAPKQTWDGGLSARHPLGPGVARGGIRVYGIGDRPASDDGTIVAPGFTQVDLHLGYRTRRFDIAFDVANLLNGNFRSAQFDTVSRLRTDPAIGSAVPSNMCGSSGRLAAPTAGQPVTNARGQALFYGCEGVDFTPAYPLTIHAMATLFLD